MLHSCIWQKCVVIVTNILQFRHSANGAHYMSKSVFVFLFVHK